MTRYRTRPQAVEAVKCSEVLELLRAHSRLPLWIEHMLDQSRLVPTGSQLFHATYEPVE